MKQIFPKHELISWHRIKWKPKLITFIKQRHHAFHQKLNSNIDSAALHNSFTAYMRICHCFLSTIYHLPNMLHMIDVTLDSMQLENVIQQYLDINIILLWGQMYMKQFSQSINFKGISIIHLFELINLFNESFNGNVITFYSKSTILLFNN